MSPLTLVIAGVLANGGIYLILRPIATLRCFRDSLPGLREDDPHHQLVVRWIGIWWILMAVGVSVDSIIHGF